MISAGSGYLTVEWKLVSMIMKIIKTLIANATSKVSSKYSVTKRQKYFNITKRIIDKTKYCQNNLITKKNSNVKIICVWFKILKLSVSRRNNYAHTEIPKQMNLKP